MVGGERSHFFWNSHAAGVVCLHSTEIERLGLL